MSSSIYWCVSHQGLFIQCSADSKHFANGTWVLRTASVRTCNTQQASPFFCSVSFFPSELPTLKRAELIGYLISTRNKLLAVKSNYLTPHTPTNQPINNAVAGGRRFCIFFGARRRRHLRNPRNPRNLRQWSRCEGRRFSGKPPLQQVKTLYNTFLFASCFHSINYIRFSFSPAPSLSTVVTQIRGHIVASSPPPPNCV